MTNLTEASKMCLGTNMVNREPMTRLEYSQFRGWALPDDERGDDEGYLVEYLDGGKPNTDTYAGYVSWFPKEQFDNAYRAVDGLSFGLAVEAMKRGNFVARKGWNGKDMFIYHVEGTVVPIEYLRGNCAAAIATSTNTAPVQDICGHIDMKAADGSIVVGWLASQTDILSDDWVIIDLPAPDYSIE